MGIFSIITRHGQRASKRRGSGTEGEIEQRKGSGAAAATGREASGLLGLGAGLRLAHIGVLSAFALAQPLFEVLSRDVAFFAVRRSEPVDLVVLVVVAIAAVPLAAALAAGLARLAGRRVALALHLTLVAVLLAVFVLPPAGRALSATAAGVVAAAVGVLGALAYARLEPLRSLLSVLSPAPLVFAGLFLFDGNVRKVLQPSSGAELPAVSVTSETTVVLLLLDELPTGSLMDVEAGIDRRLFPHFAALADASTWFRNASTSHTNTVQVIPSILTGEVPDDFSRLPIAADHPGSLFRILGDSHRMRVHETVTSVCPPALLSTDAPAVGTLEGASGEASPADAAAEGALAARLRSLFSDLAVVQGHILLPADWATGLPDVTANWGGFADGAAEGVPVGGLAGAADSAHAVSGEGVSGEPAGRPLDAGAFAREDLLEATLDDRSAIFSDFIATIESDDEPTLYFLHVLLPHYPWTTLPSGRSYPGAARTIGFAAGTWLPDDWVVAQAYQRFLLQLGHVDGLIGRLRARLEQAGVWDDALVVVAADHGLSLQAGERRRRITASAWEDIAYAPLFVKRPGQTQGAISDRHVETLDILPTIIDVLDVDLPWDLPGQSAFDEAPPRRAEKVVHRQREEPLVLSAAPPLRWPLAERKAELFGAQAQWSDVFALSTRPELVGRRIEEIGLGPVAALDVVLRSGAGLGAVELDSGRVSAMVSGEVTARDGGEDVLDSGLVVPVELAVALGGRVVAVSRSFGLDTTRRAEFLAMVSDDDLTDGDNGLQLLAVALDAEGGVRLLPLEMVDYTLEEQDGAPVLRGDDGRVVAVEPGRFEGQVDQAVHRFNDLRLMGWAADTRDRRAVHGILVFEDGRQVFRGSTGLVREKAEAVAEDPLLSTAGFQLDIPRTSLGSGHAGHLRVFALLGDVASELRTTREARWIGEVFWTREGDALLGSDGRRVELTTTGLSGKLDMARYDGDMLRLLGWAVDTDALALVDSVVILHEGEHLHAAPTWIARTNVAEHFGAPQLETAGFHFWLPVSWFGGAEGEQPRGRLELYALAGDRAFRLSAAADAAWVESGIESRPWPVPPESESASEDAGGTEGASGIDGIDKDG